MDKKEFTQFMHQHSKCQGIKPYLLYGRRNDTTSHYYVLDNNILTDLAKLAKQQVSAFKTLMNHYKDAVFILPQMVLEESIRNLNQQSAVDNLYLDFYSLMQGMGIPIYLESLEYNYLLFAEGFINTDIAFQHYKDLASKLVNNMDILKVLENAKSYKDIENSYRLSTNDAGERFIFLYAHAMLMDQVRKITILSNEKKGVYNVWRSNVNKNTLLEFLKVKDQEEYCEKLRPVSFNGFLLDFLQEQNTLSLVQMDHFLQAARSNNVIQRNPMLYSRTTPYYVDERVITNEEFLKFVQDKNEYRLAF